MSPCRERERALTSKYPEPPEGARVLPLPRLAHPVEAQAEADVFFNKPESEDEYSPTSAQRMGCMRLLIRVR